VYNPRVRNKAILVMRKKIKTKKKAHKPQRAADGKLLPGECGNPNGRPKGSKNHYSIAELWQAIKEVEGKKGKKKLLEVFVEQAYDNPTIMVALMKKLLPDLRSIEGMVATLEASMSDELAEQVQKKLRGRFL